MLRTINKAHKFDIHWTARAVKLCIPPVHPHGFQVLHGIRAIFTFFLHAVIYLLLFMHYFYGCQFYFVFSLFLWAKSHYAGLELLLFAWTKQILWPLSKLVKNCAQCGPLVIVIPWLTEVAAPENERNKCQLLKGIQRWKNKREKIGNLAGESERENSLNLFHSFVYLMTTTRGWISPQLIELGVRSKQLINNFLKASTDVGEPKEKMSVQFGISAIMQIGNSWKEFVDLFRHSYIGYIRAIKVKNFYLKDKPM